MELEINHIRKQFKKKTVLSDVSLSASAGECIGILGGNGCGKTTLLSILAGIMSADGGSVCLDGKELLKEKRLRAKMVGYVPQGTPLFGELSGKDNLLLWYDKKAMERELKDGVLALLGIQDFLSVPVNKMSGGMKKRLSIGCAVAGNQPLLLLDEPTAALDLVCKEQIWDYFRDYQKKGGILILVTHDVSEIEHCDRCYLLKDGKAEPYTYDGNVRHLVEQL